MLLQLTKVLQIEILQYLLHAELAQSKQLCKSIHKCLDDPNAWKCSEFTLFPENLIDNECKVRILFYDAFRVHKNITKFHKLKDLSIFALDYKDSWDDWVTVNRGVFFQLESLNTSSYSLYLITRYIAFQLPNLKKLTVDVAVGVNLWTILSKFPNLTELDLQSGYFKASVAEDLSKVCLPHLTSVTFDYGYYNVYYDSDKMLNQAVCFRHVQNLQITTAIDFQFGFHFVTLSYLRLTGWHFSGFRDVLSEERRHAVKILEVNINVVENVSEIINLFPNIVTLQLVNKNNFIPDGLVNMVAVNNVRLTFS